MTEYLKHIINPDGSMEDMSNWHFINDAGDVLEEKEDICYGSFMSRTANYLEWNELTDAVAIGVSFVESRADCAKYLNTYFYKMGRQHLLYKQQTVEAMVRAKAVYFDLDAPHADIIEALTAVRMCHVYPYRIALFNVLCEQYAIDPSALLVATACVDTVYEDEAHRLNREYNNFHSICTGWPTQRHYASIVKLKNGPSFRESTKGVRLFPTTDYSDYSDVKTFDQVAELASSFNV